MSLLARAFNSLGECRIFYAVFFPLWIGDNSFSNEFLEKWNWLLHLYLYPMEIAAVRIKFPVEKKADWSVLSDCRARRCFRQIFFPLKWKSNLSVEHSNLFEFYLEKRSFENPFLKRYLTRTHVSIVNLMSFFNYYRMQSTRLVFYLDIWRISKEVFYF